VFNVLGVLGVSALITPIVIKPMALRRDTAFIVGSVIALALATMLARIGPGLGVALLTGLLGHIAYSYHAETKREADPAVELHVHEAEEFTGPGTVWAAAAYLAAGLGALIIGSQLLVTSATEIARTFGVSEAVIGLTLVAVGTSLPELATSIMAALRGHADVAVGNVLGSNLFNALGIVGATALVRPILVDPHMARVDVWVMVAVSLAVVPLLLRHGRIRRVAGGLFVTAYVGYLVFLFLSTPGA
jgi:cation:H+ antiporter